jgi:MFS family permease
VPRTLAPPQPRSSLRRALLHGNVLWLSLVSLLNDTASEMIYPLLPALLIGPLGAGPTFLGLIEGAAESASSFVKLASGWLSDRFGRRKPLVVSGYGIAALARPLIALATAPIQVLAIRLTDRVGKGIRAAPRDALLAGSVPADQRGAAFGFHRAADHAGAVLGPILATGLLLSFALPIQAVIALAAVPGLVAVFVLMWKVREDTRRPEPVSSTRVQAHAGSLTDDLGAPFVRYLAVVLVFTLGNASDAFLLLRANDLGVPIALIPLLWGLHHVSKMMWSVPGGLIADRISARGAIVAGWIIYAATYAGFAYANTAWQAWALFFIYGFFYGLTEAPEKALVASLAPPHRRGAAFGAYQFAIGIGALPASLIFGILWSRFGPRTAFLSGGALALLAAAALWLVVRGRRDDTFRH